VVNLLKAAWAEVFKPLFQRPPALQVAALCFRKQKSGLQVLLVTSSNGRWILPKGWPIDGLLAHQAALREAWEEAGVKKGTARSKAIGHYDSVKVLDAGGAVQCRTYVYPVEVDTMADSYPEDDRRDRKWLGVSAARDKVAEPGLREILERFASQG